MQLRRCRPPGVAVRSRGMCVCPPRGLQPSVRGARHRPPRTDAAKPTDAANHQQARRWRNEHDQDGPRTRQRGGRVLTAALSRDGHPQSGPSQEARLSFPPRMTYPITAIAHALFQDRQQALALEGISASTKHRCEHQRPASCRRLNLALAVGWESPLSRGASYCVARRSRSKAPRLSAVGPLSCRASVSCGVAR